jgi:hypothetical protein
VTQVTTARADAPPPGALVCLIVVHAIAAAVAGMALTTLVFRVPDLPTHRPGWLAPTGRAVVAAALLAVVYAVTAWQLHRRRRLGLILAATLAVAGLLAGVVGLQGPLLVNVAVLVLLTRRSVWMAFADQ